MGTIFISHSSQNNAKAFRVRDWLVANGWRDLFLDIDPASGLAPGQRWQRELKAAGERCTAVIVLVSPDWVASRWCQVEFLLASHLGKRIFGVIIEPTSQASLPQELTAHYQLADVSSEAKESDGFERLRWGLTRAGLHPRDFPWPPPGDPTRSPYPGLRALEEIDAAVFLGREAPLVRALDALRRMRSGEPERLLVVLGASGSGKSSFLKAGVLARLRQDEDNFVVLPTVRPERAALSGTQGILTALSMTRSATTGSLAAHLSALREPAVARLARISAVTGPTSSIAPSLVLPLDQAEELFSGDHAEADEALALLRRALDADAGLLAIVTIRSDEFEKLQAHDALLDVPRLLFDLPRMSPASFREIVVGPGRLATPPITFAPELVDALVEDLSDPDALPLLSLTLEGLVTLPRVGDVIRLADYGKQFGGLEAAFGNAIDTAMTSALADPALPDDSAAVETLIRQLFIPALVQVNADGHMSRRVALRSELPPGTNGVVAHLVDARLLTADRRGGAEVVEVSHEAVLRHWKTLAGWIASERPQLEAISRVHAAAALWRTKLLASGEAAADSWLVHRDADLGDVERLLGERPAYAALVAGDTKLYLEACRFLEATRRHAAAGLSVHEQLLHASPKTAQWRHSINVGVRWAVAFALAPAVFVLYPSLSGLFYDADPYDFFTYGGSLGYGSLALALAGGLAALLSGAGLRSAFTFAVGYGLITPFHALSAMQKFQPRYVGFPEVSYGMLEYVAICIAYGIVLAAVGILGAWSTKRTTFKSAAVASLVAASVAIGQRLAFPATGDWSSELGTGDFVLPFPLFYGHAVVTRILESLDQISRVATHRRLGLDFDFPLIAFGLTFGALYGGVIGYTELTRGSRDTTPRQWLSPRTSLLWLIGVLALPFFALVWLLADNVVERSRADLAQLARAHRWHCGERALMEQVTLTLHSFGGIDAATEVALDAPCDALDSRSVEDGSRSILCNNGHVADGERVSVSDSLPTLEEQICRARASRLSGDAPRARDALGGAWLANYRHSTRIGFHAPNHALIAIEFVRLGEFRRARTLVGEMGHDEGEASAMRVLNEIAQLDSEGRVRAPVVSGPGDKVGSDAR